MLCSNAISEQATEVEPPATTNHHRHHHALTRNLPSTTTTIHSISCRPHQTKSVSIAPLRNIYPRSPYDMVHVSLQSTAPTYPYSFMGGIWLARRASQRSGAQLEYGGWRLARVSPISIARHDCVCGQNIAFARRDARTIVVSDSERREYLCLYNYYMLLMLMLMRSQWFHSSSSQTASVLLDCDIVDTSSIAPRHHRYLSLGWSRLVHADEMQSIR